MKQQRHHRNFSTVDIAKDERNFNRKEVKSMKSTGMVRKIDNLGRIVLPIELRRILEIDQDSSLQIFVDGDDIILKKYQPACIFCGEAKGVEQFKGRNICPTCRKEIGNL